MYMYMNGEIIDEKEAAISPFDHGFLYGLGLFETFRIYDGHPFLLDDHISRINEGLHELNIDFSCTRGEIMLIIDRLMHANECRNARLRLNISAGEAPVGLQSVPYTSPNVIMLMTPAVSAVELQAKKGVILQTRRNTPETAIRLKSHHYLNNVKAKLEIGNKTDIEGIFLTENGYIAEGITSNLFWVKEGFLYTPEINTGILNGITRQWIIKLAGQMGFPIAEGRFLPEDLLEADEFFYTNSVQEIVAFSYVENVKTFPGQNGEAARVLFKEYQRYKTNLFGKSQLRGMQEENHGKES
ncbi:4-amino-4-deoxychorismate lyase [Bacillus sp. OV322]|uniref:aminodeoxychorismate lyase n=1 Tax=Bacillus sp. OV322 TaxID=1882764 RepID=UPI0008E61945|nr:4-amino-4-deoxychorismate lyase [Bacillus sp. OV322]